MSKDKRKRRSFWEPESDALVKWLDAQSDLGISLELIIVDAMQRYGEGDVIRAHLRQRQQMVHQGAFPIPEPPAQTTRTERTEIRTEGVEERMPPERAEPVSEPVRERESQPEMRQPEPVPEAEQAQESAVTREPAVMPDPKLFDIGRELGKAEKERSLKPAPAPQEEFTEYDPIEVMMGDIGSAIKR